MLQIVTQPYGANIIIDSVDTGHITPALIDVPAGDHIFLLTKPGYVDVVGQISINTGIDYVINAIMQPTMIDEQLKLYQKSINLGYVGLGISLLAIFIGIVIKDRNK